MRLIDADAAKEKASERWTYIGTEVVCDFLDAQPTIDTERRDMAEIGSLRCLGCGRERGCSAHGCAILRAAADRIEQLSAQQQRIESKTNFARLTRSPEALAEFLLGAQKSDPALKWCLDEVCREHPDDEQFDCTDEMTKNCILEWLNKPEEETT